MKTKIFCKCILQLNDECVGNHAIDHLFNHSNAIGLLIEINNCDAANKHDINGWTQSWIMCPHISQKK